MDLVGQVFALPSQLVNQRRVVRFDELVEKRLLRPGSDAEGSICVHEGESYFHAYQRVAEMRPFFIFTRPQCENDASGCRFPSQLGLAVVGRHEQLSWLQHAARNQSVLQPVNLALHTLPATVGAILSIISLLNVRPGSSLLISATNCDSS